MNGGQDNKKRRRLTGTEKFWIFLGTSPFAAVLFLVLPVALAMRMCADSEMFDIRGGQYCTAGQTGRWLLSEGQGFAVTVVVIVVVLITLVRWIVKKARAALNR